MINEVKNKLDVANKISNKKNTKSAGDMSSIVVSTINWLMEWLEFIIAQRTTMKLGGNSQI